MVMDGNQTFGGEHSIKYIDIKCYTPEIYIILSTNVISVIFLKKNMWSSGSWIRRDLRESTEGFFMSSLGFCLYDTKDLT